MQDGLVPMERVAVSKFIDHNGYRGAPSANPVPANESESLRRKHQNEYCGIAGHNSFDVILSLSDARWLNLDPVENLMC